VPSPFTLRPLATPVWLLQEYSHLL
jgi:hypothetical protein